MRNRAAIILSAIVLILIFSLPAMAADPRITDVAPDHWAYQAVKKLVSQGYLGLYSDGTFRGELPVDRYTLAVLTSRMLEDAVVGKTALTKEDAELLRRLTGEFRQELVALAGQAKTLSESLARYERERTALGADMAVWRDETTKARADLAEALREILQIKERITALEHSLAGVDHDARERDERNTQAVAENTRAIRELEADLAVLKTNHAETEKKLGMMKWIAAILGVIAVLG